MVGRYATRTDVSEGRSKEELERILERFGAEEFVYGKAAGRIMVGFEYARRYYRIQVAMPSLDDCRTSPAGRVRTERSAEKSWYQERRRRWRVLCAYIKALVVGVEEGVLTWEEALLPYALLESGKTVAEHMVPRMQQAIDEGRLSVALLPGLGETE